MYLGSFSILLTSFIASDISNRDKKDLAERMGPILNEQLKYTPDFGEIIYIPLVKPLKDNNFDEFVKASNNIKKSRKRRMKIKNFIHKLKI